MKFILLVSIIFFTACGKSPEPVPLPPDYWGEVSAERNGQLWTAHPACFIDLIDKTNLVISIDSFQTGAYLKESLSLYDIPPTPGTYRVYRREAANLKKLNSALSTWESDTSTGLYQLVEADSNTNRVTLFSYDTISKEIKGSFNLTFWAKDKPFPSYPDTIRLKNGKFHGKIHQ
jgi:hypothetical protein